MANATSIAHVSYLRAQPPVVDAASIAATSFDFYVFSQTWEPYFCTTGNFQGCDSPSTFMTNHLTIHGLWPNYNSGSYPSNCGGAALTQSDIISAGASNIAKYWPDVKTGGWTFVANEWTKHGTCSGLTAPNYLKAAINIETQLGTPSIITNNVCGSVTKSALVSAYGSGKVALICAGSNNALSEVRTCYSKAYQQISCPSSILSDDSCSRSKNVRIYTF
ncbi:hypothetical protein AC1031_020468 [Aphanomyces cochlioides]|nr:hypothetical protein AC1031_020468 [Aphanomyces cochlioides]